MSRMTGAFECFSKIGNYVGQTKLGHRSRENSARTKIWGIPAISVARPQYVQKISERAWQETLSEKDDENPLHRIYVLGTCKVAEIRNAGLVEPFLKNSTVESDKQTPGEDQLLPRV